MTYALAAAFPEPLSGAAGRDRWGRHCSGKKDDRLIESAVNDMTTVVGARTLFELKQINFLVQYTQQCVAAAVYERRLRR